MKFWLFTFHSRFTLAHPCEVSLPQKTSIMCQAKRILERQTMKKLWKLTQSPFGFMVLDRTPFQHVFKTFVNPFARFNVEEYLQTVLTSDLTHIVYSVLVKNATEISKNANYKLLSKYFEMASKLAGVSIIFSSRRLQQAWFEINFYAKLAPLSQCNQWQSVKPKTNVT